MATAYLFHLVKNHPFVDGNKRVGAVAAVVFLALNDLALDAPVSEFEELVLAVAQGQADKQAIAQFFREHVS
jgi:death-on-curing protein